MRAVTLEAQRWLLALGAGLVVVAGNLAIGVGAAVGQRTLVLALAVGLLPALAIAFGALVESHRAVLAWSALALNLTGLSIATTPLPLPGGTRIVPTDVLLLLAVGAWIASRLTHREARVAWRPSVIFGLPLAVFSVAVAIGLLTGHERYGTAILGQPLRLVVYAGIALALTDVTPTAAWRAVTVVFYGGAIVQFFWALYYLATGTSQTDANLLSTGGVRVLALSVAVYLTGSLVCALLNFELERRSGRQLLHLAVAGIALFGIIVSFGRTTYAAVVLILPLLLLSRRYLRRTMFAFVPLLLPVLAVAALLVPVIAPNMVPTLQARLSGTSTNDAAVEWRARALESTLEGVSDEWLTGVGFGRRTQFEINNRIVTISGDPHNSYAMLLAGGGVLALGSFAFLCVVYVIDSLRRLRGASPHSQALVVWALAIWGAFMINAAAGPIFSQAVMLMTIWVLFALPSVVAGRSTA